MKRTRTEGSKVLACWLVAATLLHATPASAQTEADRAAARALFDHGLTLAKRGDYAAALDEFRRAYAAVPHYGVLYNIGQSQLALGRGDEALFTFRRYLAEGGGAVEATRRTEVEALVAKLQADAAPSAPADPRAPAIQPPSATPSASSTPPPGPTATEPETPSPVASAAGGTKSPPESRDSAKPRRMVAYVLGGASAVLAGAALGHYFWNRSRYQDWQTARQLYERRPNEYQRASTNDLAESVSRASVVTVALVVGASVTLGSSVVLFVTGQPSAAQSRGPLDGAIGVRGTF
jgi:tetratricopeptide (TPR) repeat protein